MKKLLFVFLLSFVCFGMSDTVAYAKETEEMKYSEYIDEVYPITMPQLKFYLDGDVVFSDKFWIFEFGDVLGFENCTPTDFIFRSGISVGNKGIADIGFNLSDMVFRLDVEYLVFDDVGNSSISKSIYDLPLSELIDVTDTKIDVQYITPDILALCSDSGSHIVLNSVSFTVYSKILNRCGTTYQYKFIYEDVSDWSISLIEQYEVNATDGTYYLSNVVDMYCLNEIDGTRCGIDTIHPEDKLLIGTKTTLDFLKEFILNFPEMLVSILGFLVQFLNMLPELFVCIIPFVPEFVIYALCYVLYFLVVLGVFKLFKS